MGEEFLLKWNDYQASFASMLESVCLTEELVDCTITAKDSSYSAHRMILSTCSPYFRSLFASVPQHQHPVIFVRDLEPGILELLVKYMYSGQVSVSEDQLVPLVQAAKSLGIKGLLDVPVQCQAHLPSSRASLPSPSTTFPSPRTSLPSPGASLPSPSRRPNLRPLSPPAPMTRPPDACIEQEQEEESLEEEEGVDPTARVELDQTLLLRRLTSEMTAFPFSGGGAESPPLPQSYSCEHCGKDFTSKRKHQRHVLNVHFGYNPVQCPFCNKGHRDNYNLKQHVCPVLNMKYGVFEKKEGDGSERPSKPSSSQLAAALALATRPPDL